MKKVYVSICLAVVSAAAFAEFKTAPEPKNVPELLKTASGKTVSTREQWETVRRPEIVKMLLEEEYGSVEFCPRNKSKPEHFVLRFAIFCKISLHRRE